MVDLSRRIEALSPEKRRLLEILRSGSGDAGRIEPEDGPFSLVSPEDRAKLPPGLEDAYPIASTQMGMLYHMSLTLDDAVPAYHNVFLYSVRFAVNVPVLAETLRRLVARHPILRTGFDLTSFSEPLQLVYREVDVPVDEIDLRGLAPEEQREVLQDFQRVENRLVLDIERPPLMRFRVFRMSDDHCYLGITECHAIAEGWSTFTTLGEIKSGYFRLLSGEPPYDQAAPASSYRDFIRLEREALRSEECRRYWSEKLRGSTPARLPRWPVDFRKSKRTQNRKRAYAVPRLLVEELQRLARSLEVPLKSVLLAAHLKVMSLLARQSDLMTGLQVHGRPEKRDSERTLGLYVNTVPLRVDLSDGSWVDLVRRAFSAELELFPFRRYPLAAMQSAWGQEKLIDVAFAFLHFHLFDQFGALRDELVEGVQEMDWSVTHFPLVVLFSFSAGTASPGLDLWLENDDSEITETQVRSLRDRYLDVLRAMVDAPHAPHTAGAFLDAGELHQQLIEWNDTAYASRWRGLIHHQFERQARCTPDAVAVICNEERFTYADLDARSNRLARYLRTRGVGPEVLVGVCMERSLEMVVALLGILKAGGAYVPFDPGYPAERLSFLWRDAECRILLTQQRFLEEWSLGGIQAFPLDRGWDEIAAESSAPPHVEVMPQNTAYVIYTSGSTGQPKGAVNTHGAICNRLEWMQQAFTLDVTDVVLQKTPFSFDVSVWEFFWPLLTGARLVVAKPGGHQDGAYLIDAIRQQEITTVHFVPSMFQEFLAQPGLEECLSLRRVICSGEALGTHLCHRFRARLDVPLFNLYGPTEAAVDVTAEPCDPATALPAAPIGRPIANTGAYVLDPEFRPVPLGVAGHLHLGGVQLARCYLRRPGLTADRFVPDPFSRAGGERLYRTGDLARWMPDGRLEFLGRIDHQVKVRGFRIELGEIEAALAKHPAVRESVVVVREDTSGDRRLVAYVVAGGDVRPTIPELRGFLRATLPDYMVPAAFLLLEALPLSPNGKVDRRALPAPGTERPELEVTYTPPQSEIERALGGLWQEILKVDRIGVHDNFFSLGGDSLLLLRLHLKIRSLFSTDLVITDLFRYPTISSLAARLSGVETGASSREEGGQRAAARLSSASRQAQIRQQRQSVRRREEKHNV